MAVSSSLNDCPTEAVESNDCQSPRLATIINLKKKLSIDNIIHFTVLTQHVNNCQATKLGAMDKDHGLSPIAENNLGEHMGRLAAAPCGSPNKSLDAHSLLACSADEHPRNECMGVE